MNREQSGASIVPPVGSKNSKTGKTAATGLVVLGVLALLVPLRSRVVVLTGLEWVTRKIFPREPRINVVLPDELRRRSDIAFATGGAIGNLSARQCRVIVVSSTACAGSKNLAKNWTARMEALVRETDVATEYGWVIFGPARDALSPFELVSDTLEIPPVLSLQYPKKVVRRWLGTASTPLTLIVDPTDTIRYARILNRVPSPGEIRASCTASN